VLEPRLVVHKIYNGQMVVLDAAVVVHDRTGRGPSRAACSRAAGVRELDGRDLDAPLLGLQVEDLADVLVDRRGGLAAGAAVLGLLAAGMTTRLALRASPAEAMRGKE
jgi:hypothetical protein